MRTNSRTGKLTTMSDQKRKNSSSPEQPSVAANLSVQIERRTHSIIREPVNSVEDAMDVAIGGEGKPWVERKRTA
jgi:hypothetical protein